jgi:hypothetical protein
MLLIDTARDSSMNVLIESSGRDITMFDYMNYCFPSDHYHRLVVHFTIDDIRFAEKSVDHRMLAEMEAGRRSILDEGDNDILVMMMMTVIMMIVMIVKIIIMIIMIIVMMMIIIRQVVELSLRLLPMQVVPMVAPSYDQYSQIVTR